MIKTIFCELMTESSVERFDDFMNALGYHEYDRPAVWARRPPYWKVAGKPRGENDDPLAVIILTIDPIKETLCVSSGFRCKEGEQIDEELMFFILQTIQYRKV